MYIATLASGYCVEKQNYRQCYHLNLISRFGDQGLLLLIPFYSPPLLFSTVEEHTLFSTLQALISPFLDQSQDV